MLKSEQRNSQEKIFSLFKSPQNAGFYTRLEKLFSGMEIFLPVHLHKLLSFMLRKTNKLMKLKIQILIFTTIISFCVQAQNDKCSNFNLTILTEKEIPDEIKVKGNLLIAKKWTDKNGENVLVVSRKGPIEETGYEVEFSGYERYAELFGQQYIKHGDNYKLLWDIYDVERNCPFDLWIGILPNSTSITDLDNDGITETTLIYKLTCRSDISPSRMKILMHENSVKMGLRGIMSMRGEENYKKDEFEPNMSKVDTTGFNEFEQILALSDRYENEKDFHGMPSVFLNYAKKQWLKFIEKDEFEQL
jgi:hypothetical protein